MNCKQGDLAVVVGIPTGKVSREIGKIVKCKSLTKSWAGVDCWILEDPIPAPYLGPRIMLLAVADQDLRPLRGDPGEDEILRIAGKPQEVTA